ncbi:MAG: hypothetical protein Ct9H300mP28_37640 [Pseudomonadota bacterium]|nr:MAG: hypothetical protein Ct9H300mP28_37640 [Pseudomonadota bacterium]
MTVPPKTASPVIIGGGVMGASTAYHLVSRGLKDVLLIEREPFFGQGQLAAAQEVFVINSTLV